MSKTSFRPRQLDALKPMPIYMAEEVPDLPQYSAINRAVHPMPSGMHKEEESEHHLQRAICTGLIIPTPEVTDIEDLEAYERMYPPNYKLPRQLIHVQPFTMEQDIPDYDMDSEDERWINSQAKKLKLTPLIFEEMLDRLEKGSGQMVVTLTEAKTLLKEDDELIIAVYDYWLNKRLKTQRPLIPTVKTEVKAGSAANNPYLAFSRRTEKMQTRKNRKNDEASYEKMLKLRRDLTRAVTLLELVKKREKTKREFLFLTVEIYEKRYQAGDFSGTLLQEVSALKNFPASRPAFAPIFPNQYSVNHWSNKVPSKNDAVQIKEKRPYKKRKHKGGNSSVGGSSVPRSVLDSYHLVQSSEEESSSGLHAGGSPHPVPEEDEDEGPFAFRRNPACNYHAPVASGGCGNWPWTSREEGGLADKKYRFCLTSVNRPRPRCVGFARRRVGRGGRIILDRESTPLDDLWSSLDYTIMDSDKNSSEDSLVKEIKNEWLHFRPKASPKRDRDEEDEDEEEEEEEESAAEEGWLSPRVGPVSLEVESMALDCSDPCPVSTVVELDLNLNSLSSDALFPSLADVSGFDMIDSRSASSSEDPSVKRRQETSPVRTFEDATSVHRRQIVTSVHSPVKRLSVSDDRVEASSTVSTLSTLLSSPIKRDDNIENRLVPAMASPNKQDWLKGSLELNGPGTKVEMLDSWNEERVGNRPTSPSIGCSSFVLCDSSSGTSSTSLVKFSPRSSRSNENCSPSPLKTMLISRSNPALPYPSVSAPPPTAPPSLASTSTSSASASSSAMVMMMNRNHVSQKTVVLNHSHSHSPSASPSASASPSPCPSPSPSPSPQRSVNTSGGLISSVAGSAMRFHRPPQQQQQMTAAPQHLHANPHPHAHAHPALSNGPLPSATAATECKLPTSLTQTI